eukprot:scaffold99496_cov18-Prasinocladus_malaysianus.AAC.1
MHLQHNSLGQSHYDVKKPAYCSDVLAATNLGHGKQSTRRKNRAMLYTVRLQHQGNTAAGGT